MNTAAATANVPAETTPVTTTIAPWTAPESSDPAYLHGLADAHRASRDALRTVANDCMTQAVGQLKAGDADAAQALFDAGFHAQALSEAHDDVRAGFRGAAQINDGKAAVKIVVPTSDEVAAATYHNRALKFWRRRAHISQHTWILLRPFTMAVEFSATRPSWANRGLAQDGSSASLAAKFGSPVALDEGEDEGDDAAEVQGEQI